MYRTGGGIMRPRRWRQEAVKAVWAATVFALVGAVLHTQVPGVEVARPAVTALLSDRWPTEAWAAWYWKLSADAPSWIPAYRGRKEIEREAHAALSRRFVRPVEGRIETPFSEATGSVRVRAAATSVVRAVDEGLVVSVLREGSGIRVAVRHPGGVRAVYGGLQSAFVRVSDWVEAGDAVGALPAGDGREAVLEFELSVNDRPLDPAAVIGFD